MAEWQTKFKRRYGVLRHLPNADRRFQFLRMFLFMLTVPWLLRLPLPRLKALLDRGARAQQEEDWDEDEVRSIIRDVDNMLPIGRPFVHSRCLSRGVTLYYFLRKAGLNVGLSFGVADIGDEPLTGHCWLIKGGEPLAEPVDPRQLYTAVYRFPEASS